MLCLVTCCFVRQCTLLARVRQLVDSAAQPEVFGGRGEGNQVASDRDGSGVGEISTLMLQVGNFLIRPQCDMHTTRSMRGQLRNAIAAAAPHFTGF